MKYLVLALALAYVLALRWMISSEVAMAILSSGGHFPVWAVLAALTVLLLRLVVFVALPAALFAALGLATLDAWPRFARFAARSKMPRWRLAGTPTASSRPEADKALKQKE